MSAGPKGNKPSAGSSEDGVPARVDSAWKRRMDRQKERRLGADEVWSTLDDLVHDARPTVTTHGFHRSEALKSGRTRVELLEATVTETRRLVAPGASEHAHTTDATETGAPGAMQQAYTTQAGAGLIAIEMKSGKIAHQSPSFQDLTSWVPVAARGNIRVSLESRDGDDFHSFCQLVVRDAGEPYAKTFLERDKVVGRSITVRFFTRAPGPPDLRNPEWLLMVRAVKLTLVGLQSRQLAGESPAGRTISEAIGVFTADLSGDTPSQWTVQAAHIRNLLDSEVVSGTWDIDTGNFKPFETIAMLFNLEFSNEGGGGGSVFSYAAAGLEYAATSALNIAQRSTSWLTRKTLRITEHWCMRLNADDTVAISFIGLAKLLGGFSTSVSMDYVGGKVGFSHGGLDVMYFVADPAQPLDRNLRATRIRVAMKRQTAGVFDVHRPFVLSLEWGDLLFQMYCKMLSLEMVGKKMPSEEDVSQLLEKLKVSPGGGLLSDGSATICVGQSDV